MYSLDEIERAAGVKLEPFQKEFIECKDKRIVANWGRKCGKTTAGSIRFVFKLVNEDVKGNGFSGGLCVLSIGEREAKAILQNIISILVNLGYIPRKVRELDGENEFYASAHEVVMKNGNRCLVLPAGHAGDTARPYSFHEKWHDEADFQTEEVYVSTSACIGRFGGTEILTSTPSPAADTTSYFARAFFGQIEGYKKYEIPTRMAGHISKEWLLKEKRKLTKAEYLREYECQFSKDANSVFERNLVSACTTKNPKTLKEVLEAPAVFMGVDFARFGQDLNVLAFASWDGKRSYIKVKVIPGRGTRISVVAGVIRSYIKEYPNIKRIVTDEMGVGAGPTDALIEEFGARKVIGITNHHRTEVEGMSRRYEKTDLYTNMVRQMEWGRIELDNDLALIRSLMNMHYMYTKAHVLNIQGPDSHIAEAIVRAVLPIYTRKGWIYEKGMLEGLNQSKYPNSSIYDAEDNRIVYG